MSDLAVGTDGRRLRREHNRKTVIDALLALFQAGKYQPSSGEIAAAAGLSPRSLFRYFADVDDLHRAAAERQVQLVLPMLQLAAEPHEPTLVKIRVVVRARAELFEQTGPAGRALRACAHRDDLLTAELDRSRSFLRAQLAEVFAPELSDLTQAVLPAIDVLCSFESYELLRGDQDLSQADAVATLVSALAALLIGPSDAS